MKKIFVVAPVKNESDIIESFCRYNLTYCDGMIIRDSGSSDNTKEIIQKLINENLPIYLVDKSNTRLMMIQKAIDEYGAGLVLPIDADEFLYHIDGVNPRKTLEELREDIEYQIPWRTYVYEKEPDIKFGFLPNNFTHYRNQVLDNACGHAGKTLATKYLIKEKQAKLYFGAHKLLYPEEYHESIRIENPEKLVCAHFPIRSRVQVRRKAIPNWLNKWSKSNRVPRNTLDMFQLGVLFNELRDNGEIASEKMKQYSLEYSVRNGISNLSADDLKKIETELGDGLIVNGPMDVSFCADKLKLRYTNYKEDYKTFFRATLKEIDSTVTFLSSESDEKSRQLQEITQSLTYNCFLFFDTGNGYNVNELQSFSFTGNEVEISCQVPENTVAIRLDPVEEHGCVISNLEILSYGGIVKYEPLNGFMDKAGNLVFTNTDPQISLPGAAHWLKIKYRILLLSDFAHFEYFDKVLDDYAATEQEINALTAERDNLTNERNVLLFERNNLIAERNSILNSRSWRITKPLRKFTAFLRRNRVLYSFAKGILSLKRNGFVGTVKKIRANNKRKKLLKNQSSSLTTGTLLSESERLSQESTVFQKSIKISIITPLYNTPEKFLIQMIDSVRSQTYPNWELCLADGSDKEYENVKHICNEYAQKDNRIKYKKLDKNLGISGNSNKAIEMSTGDYIGLLDHDDVLLPNALYENAIAIQETNADVLYSDEEFTDVDGIKHYFPFFKPDWSRDMLYSQMYICHLLVIKKEILDKAGWFNTEFNGSQDYDLMLRLSEHTELIYHIPKLLYSWRAIPTSTSINADSKSYAQDAGLSAINAHLLRRYNNMAYALPSSDMFVYDTRFNTMQDKPMVSIIIPMRDMAELTDQCIQSIISKSTYKNFEIIIIDNNSSEQDTFNWFCKIKEQDPRIDVIKADFEFNWSKINNYGMRHAKGTAYIFLNNDTTIITGDWIERLCENALREDIGAVGPLLLFEDGTIQHAGVVVGMGGWAEHVFRGMPPVNSRSPYVSPTVNRNVLAVTGACMCVSRKTLEKIGLFDENFIICGSDVEFCIRAYEAGLSNLYNASVRLYHYESKTRDSFIPEIDFKMSSKAYAPYRENVDPYFNPNLDINSVIPFVNHGGNMNIQSFRNFLKRNDTLYKISKKMLNAIQNQVQNSELSVEIFETTKVEVRLDTKMEERKRLNLIVPSLNIEHVFGGIATAISFFQELCNKANMDSRIIVIDSLFDEKNAISLKGYRIVSCDKDSSLPKQIVDYHYRAGKTISVGKNDIFVATAWWTAYNFFPVINWQKKYFDVCPKPLIYLIQDYEPGFYPFSSRYVMADSTYKSEIPTIAVFNSRILYDFFKKQGYSFEQEYFFDPVLNKNLRECLLSGRGTARKKQIIIYGRPSVPRNAFELIVAALRLWVAQEPNIKEWTILSVGETHPEITLSNGVILRSLGKLSLEEYALLMKETYMAVSLMVSPHPSYPPLEMSTFGVKTITNRYANKDLGSFNKNVISLDNVSAQNVAKTLLQLASEYPNGAGVSEGSDYIDRSDNTFSEICEKIVLSLN